MRQHRRWILAVTAVSLLALAVAACGEERVPPVGFESLEETESAAEVAVAEEREPTAVPTPIGRDRNAKLAPELAGINSWINSEPFTLASQRGKVVLIDFWTYTCINCIRTFPFLRQWHDKYADQGLVIVGVHAPEFEFEKVRENVVDAAAEHGLEYAIAQDNEHTTWKAFNNRYWPAKYLIDADGYIRYTHFGEGAYDETEQQIRDLLEEAGTSVANISSELEPEKVRDPAALTDDIETSTSRELYAGFERNYGALQFGTPPYVRNQDYYLRTDVDITYTDPGDYENHFIYLQGEWRNGPESLTHARQTENYEDYIAIKFYATTVNAVMRPERGTPSVEVRVTIDGAPLAPDQAGEDVTFAEDGTTYIVVDSPKMYRVVKLAMFEGHELRLSTNSPDLSLFAYTFGSYQTDAGT